MSASTAAATGAQSLTMGLAKASPSRTAITATPCCPMGPLTSTASPGRTSVAPSGPRARTTPTPLVCTKTPSPLPRSTTLVSPVTITTFAARAAAAMDATTRRRSATANPSSRMSPRLR